MAALPGSAWGCYQPGEVCASCRLHKGYNSHVLPQKTSELISITIAILAKTGFLLLKKKDFNIFEEIFFCQDNTQRLTLYF